MKGFLFTSEPFNPYLFSTRRSIVTDFSRGIAIILMVLFHLCFDLQHFSLVSIDIYHGDAWRFFRYTIISIFLLCVGVSLHLAYHHHFIAAKIFRRLTLLGTASAAITLVSLLLFPKSWIYFGILHFILLASLIGLLFVRLPRLALLLGISIIVLWNLGYLSISPLYAMTREPLHLPVRSEDLVPFIPWFGAVLIGIYTGSTRLVQLPLPYKPVVLYTAFAGRHALLLYLVHQVLLFPLIYLVSLLK